ncbi:hypothetical protein M406DRAFT_66210 [Cryphonectria parasitica EP155]|uniref:Uncharacterized protein n=1 Tax=Cryphonectria parasitica (strain ATCC 38755 / EP155) TaxID=660469 RepID=A0A9P4YB97_CRYP1|nr:uncharacterized protein M406DRAFT_66210 [Cryphonectria parasitica EP155]KAF3769737.1 hypothetical protein M406DRAFT_66210 [Cryphonectria parasitica EP155]
MDRNQQATTTTSLMFREGETIAEILQAYQKLVAIATDRITNKASIGQAAHNSMAMQLETQRLVCYRQIHVLVLYPADPSLQIKGVENLLALTRRIRELWIIGPLRKPEEDGRQLEESINTDVQIVADLLNQLRSHTRQQYVSAGGGYGQYVVGSLAQPIPPGAVPMSAAPPPPPPPPPKGSGTSQE